ncbi:MAG: hypothetical protein ABL908_01200 [Hyphomicrobium sp.]
MKLTIAAVALAATALALPAIAAETADQLTSVQAAVGAEMTSAAEARQAQRILLGKGYDTVSTLERAQNGHWVGTATKAGKTIMVSVYLPKPVAN